MAFFCSTGPPSVHGQTHLFSVMSINGQHSAIFYGLRMNKGPYTLKAFLLLRALILKSVSVETFFTWKTMDHFSNTELSYLKYIPTRAERHRYNQCLDHTDNLYQKCLRSLRAWGDEREGLYSCQNVIRSSAPSWTRYEGFRKRPRNSSNPFCVFSIR